MKKLIISGLLGILVSAASAQDIHFTQFWETGALLNPALTGLGAEKVRAGLQYRDQWSALNKTYRTGLVHVDAPLLGGKNRRSNIGLGGYAFFDKAAVGALSQNEIALQVSGMVSVAEGQWISAGIRTAYMQYSANMDAFQWGMQFDGTGYNPAYNSFEVTGMSKTNNLDFSAGLAYHYRSGASKSVRSAGKTEFTFGAAYHHIAAPSIGFFDNAEKLRGRLMVMGTGRVDFGTTKSGLLPGIYYSYQRGQQELNLGALFRYGLGTQSKYTGLLSESEIGAGMYYRVGDALIAAVRFQTSHLAVGVSYDITMSKLGGAVRGNGGWEVSILMRNIGGIGNSTMGKASL